MLRATFFPLPLNFCHRPNPNPNPTTISAAYRRIPLDTPDAYRLVDDDDSTEVGNFDSDFPSKPPKPPPPTSKDSGFAKLKHAHKVRSLLLRRNIQRNTFKDSNFGDPQHFSEDQNVAFGPKTRKYSNFGDDPQHNSLENHVKTAAFGQKTRKNTKNTPKGSNFAGILGDPQDNSEEDPVKSEAFGRKTRKNTKSSTKGSNFAGIAGHPQDYSDGFSNFGGEFKERATKGGSFYRKTNKNATSATQSDTFDRKTYRRNTDGAIDSNFDRIIGDQLDSSDDEETSDEGLDQDSDFRGQSENQPRKERGRGWGDSRDRYQEEQVKYPKRKKSAFSKASQGGGFFSKKSFKELGCSEDMLGALRELDFLRPSNIQAMAYGPILEGKTCVVADQSGSGKTLAYLAPTVQCLRQEEVLVAGKPSSKNPRAVILVPTAELASQVLNNCRAISKHGVPFRSMVATGGFRQKTQLESLQEGLDVLIATPGRFLYLCKEGFLDLSSLRSVVLDEVDILFGDEEFKDVLKSLISSAPVSTQYLFVTATLPVDIYNKLVEIFPDCEMIMGPGMHRTSSRLEEVLVDCSGDGEEKTSDSAFNNKKSALLQIVESDSVPKTIVFCNKIETCRKIENILKRTDRKEHQVRVLPFHAAIEQQSRNSNMKEFLNLDSNESLFLICTDRASRGIDFTNVDHVILFDFPREPSEYVRRVGRTARGAGGKGKAYVFAVGKQVSLARRIIERNQKGHPLHNVPSAYELEGSMF